MDSAELIQQYFPGLSDHQKKQYELLKPFYQDWNQNINVISRKDIDNFYLKHCLHALGIAKVYSFLPEQRVLDVGTGGGFPGIPLAIMFPKTEFLLVDSIAKKIKVVNEVATHIGLTNVTVKHQRAEQVAGQFHFVVSRAVTRMKPFYQWINSKILSGKVKNGFGNGIFCLKGGDLTAEMAEVNKTYKLFDLNSFFEEEFFETKKVVYLPG